MAEELGTRDLLEQIDSRLGNVERDVRDLRSEMVAGFDPVESRLNIRIDAQSKWLVGLIFGTLITLMASIWLKG